MNSIQATTRNTNTKGQVRALRQKGEVPGIIYGGTEENLTISLSTKEIKTLIDQENFLSNIISLKIDGKSINVLPRDVAFDPISDNPIHVDFLRIVKIDLDYFDSLKGESDTLAGLVLEIEGKIPKIGKICKIPPFTFTIESSDQRRIKRIKVTIDE